MLEQFLNHIEQNLLCTPEQKILLAVSGGLDSMVMLHLFKKAGYAVAVAHCNFQLRGGESEGDEEFVKQICDSLTIPFHTKRFGTEAHATNHGVSIQMAARELRYAWFDELLEQEGMNRLATAHHLNDSIETVVLNWIHGGSIESFSGIPVINGRIIRPMLFATRDSIEKYAKENQISWREDSSNQTDDYSRNFVRHQVLPKLKEINPSLETTLERGMRRVHQELTFFEKQVDEWKAQHLKQQGSNIMVEKKSIVNAALLWNAIKVFGFNFDQCESIMSALHGQAGKQFEGTSHRLTIDRSHLILSPIEIGSEEVKIEQGQDKLVQGSWMMRVSVAASLAPSADPLVATVDAANLKFPLTWRTWKPGDYFFPLGMNHKQKLSDFLIDRKVPLPDKRQVTVLESDGQIVWVVGHRIDNRFKITAETRSALSFLVQPHFT